MEINEEIAEQVIQELLQISDKEFDALLKEAKKRNTTKALQELNFILFYGEDNEFDKKR